MSELSIVLDLRLLGKMWHGTRDEQIPLPVRMTLGNKGAVHRTLSLLSVVVSLWLSLLCIGVSTGCRWKPSQHGISAVFIRGLCSDWSLLRCWVTWPLGLLIWVCLHFCQVATSEWNSFDCLDITLKINSGDKFYFFFFFFFLLLDTQGPPQLQLCDSVVCCVCVCVLWLILISFLHPFSIDLSGFQIIQCYPQTVYWLSALPTAWRS